MGASGRANAGQRPAFPWPLFTDRERCYDTRGAIIPCGAGGQDAGRGAAERGERRFLTLSDRVSDTWTGLHWSRDANPFAFPYTLEEAFDLVDGMNGSARHDLRNWRLPSRRELFSLVSHQNINPALPHGHPFANVFPGTYWTATTSARLTAQAWYVHLGGARVYRGMKTAANLIWPVAGPPVEDLSGGDFRMDGPIFHDCRTGRCWTRSAFPLVTWEQALEAAAALNQAPFGGRTDWRIPNIRELESLVDLTRHSPALAAGHPFAEVPEGCWSSTTSVYEPRYAWVLYTRDGAVGVGFKQAPTFGAWAVAGCARA